MGTDAGFRRTYAAGSTAAIAGVTETLADCPGPVAPRRALVTVELGRRDSARSSSCDPRLLRKTPKMVDALVP